MIRIGLRPVTALILAAVLLGPSCGSGGSGGPPPPAIPGPASLTATTAPTTVSLTWPPVAGATSYTLYYATQPGLTASNWSSLTGGTTVVGVTSTHLLNSLPSVLHYFIVTASLPGGESAPSPEASLTPLPALAPATSPIGTVYPIAGTLEELVYDSGRDRVYITNSSQNHVELFNAATSALLPSLTVGTSPVGIDLRADGSTLYVCPWSLMQLERYDLSTNPPTALAPLSLPTGTFNSRRPRTVVCTNTDKAFVANWEGGKFAYLWKLDLPTSTWTELPALVTLNGGYDFGVSQDRSIVTMSDTSNSGGWTWWYTASSDTWTTYQTINSFVSRPRLSPSGSTLALSPGPHFTKSDLRIQAMMPTANVAFCWDPGGAFGWRAVLGTSTLQKVDVARAQVIDQFPLNGTVNGPMTLNPAGTRLYAVGTTGLIEVVLPTNRPPSVEAEGTVVVNAGEKAGITLQARDPEGASLLWVAGALPPNATFDPNTRLLEFSPTVGQIGSTSATVYVSDRTTSVASTINFQVTASGTYSARVIPTQGLMGELVYDPPSDRLYAANSDKNRIEVIEVGLNRRLDPLPAGARAWGLDISADRSKLVICPSGSEFVDVLSLASGTTTRVPVNSTLDRWPYDVACTSTGKAIFSITQIYTGGGIPQLCQVDLGSLIGSSRSDTPNLPEPAMLRATADRTRVFVTADYLTTKTVLKFDALADNFPTSGIGPGAFSTIDVKSDGSRVLVCPGPRVFDGTLSTLGDIAAGGTFAAFRQGTSTAYSHAGATQISILNVTGLSVSGSFTLPVAAAGRMRCDPAGTRLFVATQNGVAIVSLP